MGVEIERKFLLSSYEWKKEEKTKEILIKQGYLSNHKSNTIRIRTMKEDYPYAIIDSAVITIKHDVGGIVRKEYEYPIPFEDAEELMSGINTSIIEKVRYVIEVHDLLWEIDVFKGDNEGLVVAEVELETEDQEITNYPSWIGQEVTHDKRYLNAFLVHYPFNTWDD